MRDRSRMQQKRIEELRLGTRHKLTENVKAGDYVKILVDDMIERTGERPIVADWEEIVGPILYGHVFLESIKDTKIVVKAEHPSFASAVRLQERQILRRLKERFPSSNIKSIQVY